MTGRVGVVCGLAVAAVLAGALSGCASSGDPVLGTGLTGHVFIEVAPELVNGIPTLVPVAVVLSPTAVDQPNLRPLAGADVEVSIGGTRLAHTTTDTTGVWALPRRGENAVALSAFTPTGLFDTAAPAPVVRAESVALTQGAAQPWPPLPRRIPKEQIVDDISITIEGARAR